MGVAVALATFLKFKGGRLGGVIGLNGAHHAKINYSNLDLPLKRKTPIFLNSGKADRLFPANISELSYQVLYDKEFTLFLQKENNLDQELRSTGMYTKMAAFFKEYMTG